MKRTQRQHQLIERGQKAVRRTFATRLGKILLMLIVLLVGARIALPHVVERFVNRKLQEIPGYSGSVEDIDLAIVRGAYVIKGITLDRTTGKVPVPFFRADKVDLSVQWKELIHGSLVGEIEFEKPELNFVAGKSEEDSQTKVSRRWQDVVRDLFPLRINRFQVNNGEVHFRSFTSKPDIDVFIHSLYLTARNLTNSEKISKSLVATIDAQGMVLNDGVFKGHLEMDPYARYPTFQMDAEMTNVDMRELNDFLLAYGKFDVERGRFSLFGEFVASGGRFEGYVKPLFRNVEIVNWERDKKNPTTLLWESIVGGIKDILTNKEKEQVATKIPLSGRFEEPGADTWVAIGNLLRNAFVQAILPGFDKDEETAKAVPRSLQTGGRKK